MTHKHHHHHHGECCEHEEEASCCHSHTCHEEHEEGCHFAEQLLEVADQAWMEVVKEKMKKQIESTSGKKLDDLAKIVTEANHARWKGLMAGKHCEENYKEKLRAFFSEDKK